MHSAPIPGRAHRLSHRQRDLSLSKLLGAAILTAISMRYAHAVDGCTVMLCLAAPDWKQVPMCVPPVRELLDDLKRGRPFPTCDTGGDGNESGHRWSSAPDFCPPQYTRTAEPGDGAPYPICDYAGAITITVLGTVWTRTWWSPDGPTVTEFSDAAKAQLGTWDTRFEDDYAAWLAALPAPPSDTGS